MCPNQQQLLRCVSGTLTADEQGVGEHVRECAACAGELAELQAVWDLMGEWQVDAPADDLSRRIMSRALADSGRKPFIWRMRVAASVLLAAGLGVAIGSVVPVAEEAEQASVTQDEVVQWLGLDEMGGVPGGLAGNLETEDPA